MRILFISQLFDPEYSIKGLALMKHWVAQGHEVEVLTTYPNYPTGKVFDGYKVKFCTTEMIDGVKITRLWSHISHSKSKLSRAASYLSYTFMALFAALFSKKPDLVYTYHPQSTTGVIGILMRMFRGVPFVTDVQDLWPDALTATGMNEKGVLLKWVDRWCKLVYRKAAQIVVLSDGFGQALINRGVAADKINLVYNWCPEELRISQVLATAPNAIAAAPAITAPASFVYAGNMGAAQSLKAVVDAAAKFDQAILKLTLIGGGVEKEELRRYVSEQAINNVIISDYVPASQIIDVLNQADVLVIHLRDDPLFRITIPSKTQSSLAMGKPVLMAVGGEANQLINQANAGVIAEPENVESLTNAIEQLLVNRQNWPAMGENARQFYLNQLSAATNYAKLDKVLIKAVN